MPFYRGDYYRGDSNYYRGDPWLQAAGVVGGAIGRVFRGVKAAKRLAQSRRALRALGRAGELGTAGAAGYGFGRGAAEEELAPEGVMPGGAETQGGRQGPGGVFTNVKTYPTRRKSGMGSGKPSNYPKWRRTMNPLNPKALRRALRRAEGFEKFAKRTMSALYTGGRRTFKKRTPRS